MASRNITIRLHHLIVVDQLRAFDKQYLTRVQSLYLMYDQDNCLKIQSVQPAILKEDLIWLPPDLIKAI
jgi:hypothetical protein